MSFQVIIDHSAKHPVIQLKNNASGCEVELFTFGSLLNAFKISTKDGLVNVVDGFKNTEDAITNVTKGFKSAKLSPFVCRLNKGAYSLNGTTYNIAKYLSNGHALHGIVYDCIYTIEAHEANETSALVSLSFAYDGSDNGYPFNYKMTVTWKLETNNKLTATTFVENTGQSPIPIADGWHPYFKLGNNVDECTLQFSDAEQLVYNDELIPTGEKIKEDRFVESTILKGVQLDNGFEFVNKTDNNRCVLKNETLEIIIEPGKNYPVFQIYIPPHRKSIAIENLSGAPDNFNNKIGLIMLQPNEKASFTTSYQVKDIRL